MKSLFTCVFNSKKKRLANIRKAGFLFLVLLLLGGATKNFALGQVAPTITSTPTLTVPYGTPYKYSIAATTEGGSETTITAPTLPSWLSLTEDSGDPPTQLDVVVDGASIDMLSAVAGDAEGNLYVITFSRDIYKVSPDGTGTLWREGLASGSINSMLIVDDYLYISRPYVSDNSITRIPLDDPSAGEEIFASLPNGVFALTNKDNFIYAASLNPIYKIEKATGNKEEYLSFTNGLSGEGISGLDIDSEDNLYITTWNSVLKYNETGLSPVVSDLEGGQPNAIVHDDAGNFYVGIYSGGIRRYTPDFSSYEEVSTDAVMGLSYASGALAYIVADLATLFVLKPITALSGTPTKADIGEHTVIVQAANTVGSTQQEFTITVTDETAPVAETLLPADNATDVSRKTDLSITFDEEVSLGTTGTLTLLDGTTTLKTYDLSIAEDRDAFTLSEDNLTLTLALSDNLPATTTVSVAISAGFVQDGAGNDFEGITAASGAWDFTTNNEAVAPTITSTPTLTVPYGTPYKYNIAATTEGGLETMFSATTMPSWLNFSNEGAPQAVQLGNIPSGVVIGAVTSDDEGNIYTAANHGTTIYKIAPDGTTEEWCSDLTMSSVYDLCIANNFLYIARFGESTKSVTRISLNAPSDGEETFISITGGVTGLAYKDGFMYAISPTTSTNTVNKIEISTKKMEFLISVEGSLNNGYSILDIDSDGHLYFTSSYFDFVKKYDGESVSTLISGLPSYVRGITHDDEGNFYLGLSTGIRKYTPGFTSEEVISETGNTGGLTYTATGVLAYSISNTNQVYTLQAGAVLSGTPTKADLGEHTVIVQAANTVGSTQQEFTITVTDETAPVAETLLPADNATDVSRKTDLSITFDEEVSLGTTGTLTLLDGTTTLATYDLSVAEDRNAFTLSEDNLTLTLALNDNLPATTTISVAISAGFVQDGSGNDFEEMTAASGAWDFTTNNEAVAPTITSTPTLTVPYGTPYKYNIAATTEGGVETTITAPTLPSWLNFTDGSGGPSTKIDIIVDGNPLHYYGALTCDEMGNLYIISMDGTKIYKTSPDGTGVLWCEGLVAGDISSLHIANAYLYISRTNESTSSITRVPLDDPSAKEEIFASISGGVFGLTDKDRFIYAAAYSGDFIYQINEETKDEKIYLNFNDFGGSRSISGLDIDSEDNLYIATTDNSIFKYNGTALSTVVTGIGLPLSIVHDDAGNFYVGMNPGGIRRYTPDFSSSEDVSSDPALFLTYVSGDLVYMSIDDNNTYILKATTALSGTPTKADIGEHTVIVQAANTVGSTQQEFTITVTDETAPVAETLLPADNATEVSRKTDLSITFDEEVSLGTTGTLTLLDGTTTLETYDLSVAEDRNAFTLSEDNLTLTLALSDNLPATTIVSVAISAGFVQDGAGNDFEEMTAASGAWDFTTNNEAVEPTITSTPTLTVPYGTPYKYSIAATTEGDVETTITAPTLPLWLSLTEDSGDPPTPLDVVVDGVSITGFSAVTGDAEGNLYVITTDGTKIYKVSPEGTGTLWCEDLVRGIGSVFSMLIVDNYLYIPRPYNSDNSITRISLDDPSAGEEIFASLHAGEFPLTNKDNFIYAASSDTIYKIEKATGNKEIYLSPANGLSTDHVYGLVFDSEDNLYIIANYSVLKYNETGLSPVVSDLYNFPRSIAYDDAGNFYGGMDYGGIRRYTPDFSSYEEVSTDAVMGLSYASGALAYISMDDDNIYILKATMALSGTPTKADLGEHTVIVQAANEAGSTQQEFTIMVTDETAPVAENLLPADNATDVSRKTDLSITFDEEVSLGATGTLTLLDGTTTLETYDLSVAEDRDAFTLSEDGLTLSLARTGALPMGSTISVEISAGFVQDGAGNDFEGITAASGAWDFTTDDQAVSPTITSTPTLTVPYGTPYKYNIEATTDGNLETTITVPTLPSWLNFSEGSEEQPTQLDVMVDGAPFSDFRVVAGDAEGNLYAVGLSSDEIEIYKISPDGTGTLWCSGLAGGSVSSLLITNNYLYIPRSGESTNLITRIPLDNPSAGEAVFASITGDVTELANKGDFIYAANYGRSRIYEINKATGDKEVYLSSSNGLSGQPFGLDIDSEGNLYIATFTDGSVLKYNGTTLTTVISDLNLAISIVHDDAGNFYVLTGTEVLKYTSDFSSSEVVSSDNAFISLSYASGTLAYVSYLEGESTIYVIKPTTVLSGTPTKADVGEHTVVVQAANTAGSTEQNFIINVVDEIAPVAETLLPADNAMKVSRKTGLSITFDEEVSLANIGTLTLMDEDNTLKTYDLSVAEDRDAFTLSADKLTLSLELSDNLPTFTTISVGVSPGFVKDESGNDFAGITAASGEWTFTTANLEPQTISFTEISDKTYGDASFTLGNATTDQGLTVTYTAADPTVVSITGNMATILSAGTTTITATQEGDGTTYDAATPVEQNLLVNPKAITVTVDADQSKVYGAVDPALTYDFTPALESGDEFSGELMRNPGEDVDVYAIKRGTLSAGENYELDFISANFSITAKPITVTADAGQNKVFGEKDPTFTYDVSPALEDGDEFSGKLSRDPGEDAGTYSLTQGTLSAGSNYDLSFVGADFSITPTTITVTADANQSKIYGNADPVFTYNFSPALPGDGSFSGELSRESGENAGTYAITLGTLTAGENYNLNLVSADFSITPRKIAVTADFGQSKIYGEADPTFTYAVSPGLVSGDTFSGELSREPGENAGDYAITRGTLGAGSNYSIVFASNLFAIEKAAQTITFNEIPVKNTEDAGFMLDAIASSGLPVSYSYSYTSTSAPATVTSEGEVDLLLSGEIQITASQDGNENYLAAETVTRTLRVASSDATIHELTIGDVVYDNPEEIIYYQIDCNDGALSVTLNYSTETNASSSEDREFIVNAPVPGIYEETINVTSEDETKTETYRVVVEKMFPYEDIVVQKHNNILLVNNNPETNGGYYFTEFNWYKDGELIGTGQYYSAGSQSTDQLDENANYSVEMTDEKGDVLHTCDFGVALSDAFNLSVAPNPVRAGSTVIVTTTYNDEMLSDRKITISNMQGTPVFQENSATNSSHITLPSSMASGTYVVTTKAGGVELSKKIIIQ